MITKYFTTPLTACNESYETSIYAYFLCIFCGDLQEILHLRYRKLYQVLEMNSFDGPERLK